MRCSSSREGDQHRCQLGRRANRYTAHEAAYLKALRADGLNHTRLFTGSYREIPGSFGITDNTLAPLPHRYLCPWARSSTAGYDQGGNKFDLKKWDEDFFSRLKDFMTQPWSVMCPKGNQ